jgi:hypothetical protein
MGCHCCCCYYYNEVERKSLILMFWRQTKQRGGEQKIHERTIFFLITKRKRYTLFTPHTLFTLLTNNNMPSVASFAVKKDDVVHAQANDTIKRCVEMLVMKGGLLH